MGVIVPFAYGRHGELTANGVLRVVVSDTKTGDSVTAMVYSG